MATTHNRVAAGVDNACTKTARSLISTECSRTSRDQAGDVGHVGEQVGVVAVRQGAHALVVVVPRVRRRASHDQLRPEQRRILLQARVVDDASGLVQPVGHRLHARALLVSQHSCPLHQHALTQHTSATDRAVYTSL